jgi:hypothetical protein
MITANIQSELEVKPSKACNHYLIHLFIFIYLFDYIFGILGTEEPLIELFKT